MANNSFLLCVTYFLFLILGGFIFMFLEWEKVEQEIIIQPREWIRLKDLVSSPEAPSSEDELSTLIGWLLRKCPNLPPDVSGYLTTPGNQSWIHKDVERRCAEIHVTRSEEINVYRWTFIESVYFSMTVATTIGYGHISPKTSAGRIICMLYSLVGIPLTGILLAWTSSFFGERLFALYTSKLDSNKQQSHTFIILGTIFYILIGFAVFIFLPAILFTFIEEWTYLEAVYFAYITLTTIGFGDFVTGSSMTGVWLYVYQFGVIFWIMIGLGYWVMVANFITRALKSKKMYDLAKKASELKKLMANMRMSNSDPEFVSQKSKAAINLMLQLSSALACPESFERESPDGRPPSYSTISPLEIPGISSLFGKGGVGPSPFFSHMLGASIAPPLIKESATTEDNKNLRKGTQETTSDNSPSVSLLPFKDTASPTIDIKNLKFSNSISQIRDDSSSSAVITSESDVFSTELSNENVDNSSIAEIEDLPNDYVIQVQQKQNAEK